jgi:hypothetical protein
LGVEAKSAAVSAAEPRQKAKGDCIIRPKRIGIRFGSLPSFDSPERSTGSRRSSRGSREP